MSSDKKIEHSGVVIEQRGSDLKVEILQSSACASCGAAKLCTSAESKSKIVDVWCGPGEEYKPGETVWIEGSVELGMKAVFLAYVVPLIIVVIAVIICKVLGAEDSTAGLIGLVSFMPYLLLLYTQRAKLEKEFKFKTKNQIK